MNVCQAGIKEDNPELVTISSRKHELPFVSLHSQYVILAK
jgi:hypothetical protein